MKLSIVPYWNWNKYKEVVGLEKKHSQSYHTGIEMEQDEEYKQLHKLSIVPYWNWNYHLCWERKWDTELSIVPYWNWNEFLRSVQRSSIQTLNRTILELKFASITMSWIKEKLSIVPYWNWNLAEGYRNVWSFHSQSYHTGIEIHYCTCGNHCHRCSQSYHTENAILQRLLPFLSLKM